MRPWLKQIAKMKISSEVKVSVIGIVTLLVLIWGINYLKGKNILASTYALHAFYDDAGGLENSAPVLMNGVKVGYVESLELRPEQKPAIHLVLHIERAYPLRKGSTAALISADLIGTRAIRIDPRRPHLSREVLESGQPVKPVELDTLDQDLIAGAVVGRFHGDPAV